MSRSVLRTKADVEHPEAGLGNRERPAASLTGLLADTCLLQVKSQGYPLRKV